MHADERPATGTGWLKQGEILRRWAPSPAAANGRAAAEENLAGTGGKTARTAAPIPSRSWKAILLSVYRGIDENRILASAAAVTFYVLLAIFPAIAALVSIYALFVDPRSIAEHLNTVSGLLPGGALDIIRDQLNRLTASPQGALGLSFVIGLGISLWSANGGIKALFDALNVVYEQKERRGFIRFTGATLAFTVALIAFLILALACLVALPAALSVLPGFVGRVLSYTRWPVLLVLVDVAFACLYRFGPSRSDPQWRWLTWGSASATIGWLLVSALFTWYAANFGDYNKTYGSLGAVIGFMMWIWLSVIVILIGGKLDAEIERSTAENQLARKLVPAGQGEPLVRSTRDE
jgi:membrane protein